MHKSLAARLTTPAAVALGLVFLVVGACSVPQAGASGATDVRVASSEPFTWDPAQAGDAGTASVLAQVFEGLTAFDANGGARNLRPERVEVRRPGSRGRRWAGCHRRRRGYRSSP